MKLLYQEGQYAAEQMVTLIGPRSRIISNLRILGPCRTLNQVELAYTDSIMLGFALPGDGIHGPNERQHLPTLFRGVEAYIRFLYRLGGEQ